MTSGLHPVVVHGADAEVLPEIGHHLLADAPATGGALSTHRVRLGAGDDGAAPHRHAASSELFFVVDGLLEVLVGEVVVPAGAGDLVVVPPGVGHAFAAAPAGTADVLVVLTPGVARFDYLRQVARIRAGHADPESLDGDRERWDTFVVDSPVWRTRRAVEARITGTSGTDPGMIVGEG